MSKRCTKCEIEKSFSEFYPNVRTSDGKQSQCRKCNNKQSLQWKQNNSEIVKKCGREYQNDRYANDMNFKLAKNLRNRLRKALLRQLTSKNDKTEDLLGISYSEFRNYVEFLMTNDMDWDNIELDHVRPLSSFDLKDIEQLKEASHYSNIQPLLQKDNRVYDYKYYSYLVNE